MTTCLLPIALALVGQTPIQAQPSSPGLDGVTFADKPGVLLVPLREIGASLKWSVDYDEKTNSVSLNGKPVKIEARLFDGTPLISLTTLSTNGVKVDWNESTHIAALSLNDTDLNVKCGDKRVVVDKGRQWLEAYQGDRLVLSTNVSTGRPGHGTPSGSFTAGPAKERIHYSHLYENAPMPWAVQVHDNVFIHGYTSVPHYPASHGCVRMPLTRGNPAHWFYRWCDVGTPVTISGEYVWRASHRRHRRRRV